MNIRILIDGKLKESYFKEGVLEFQKRLSGFVDLKIIETNKLYEYCISKNNIYIVTLEIEGKMLDSVSFAQKLKDIQQEGFYSEIVFLIGGSDGLEKRVRNLSNFKFSMSKLTFLHQEALLILVEQIYRAFKILNNETYHK
ncbi:MAG: 23S rRNA (pseudouridine(1915)-N(3))-methyltransferase RlmH [Cyanobacteria bacterium SIG30]|nr:23S rRNA (pseudouridine(1915)-N(3))-methyltransferase RlmH [Cyanobacteria bacterium SIG30]